METLKLISVRLDRDTLRAIDEQAKRLRYMKRSWVINRLLKLCVTCTTDGDLWRMINTYDAEKKGYRLSFRVDPDFVQNPHKTDY